MRCAFAVSFVRGVRRQVGCGLVHQERVLFGKSYVGGVGGSIPVAWRAKTEGACSLFSSRVFQPPSAEVALQHAGQLILLRASEGGIRG